MGSQVSNESNKEIKTPIGTDVTYHEGDLLKYTDKDINYDSNPPKITVEEIPVPEGYLIHNILTKDECDQYIKIAEEMGFGDSPLRNLDEKNSTNFSLSEDTKRIRTSLRVLFDVPERIGKILNDRVAQHLPQTINYLDCDWTLSNESTLCGGPLNKRWRINKYREGDYFKPHFDAGYEYSQDEKTLLTFILYLSDGFDGGETTFYPDGKKYAWDKPEPGIEFKVTPKIGTALVFIQVGKTNPRHEGATLLSNDKFKYILRSDVGYVKKK